MEKRRIGLPPETKEFAAKALADAEIVKKAQAGRTQKIGRDRWGRDIALLEHVLKNDTATLAEISQQTGIPVTSISQRYRNTLRDLLLAAPFEWHQQYSMHGLLAGKRGAAEHELFRRVMGKGHSEKPKEPKSE